MVTAPSLLTGVVEGLLQVGGKLGIERRRLLAAARLDESELLDRDARVPIRCQLAIAEEILAARPRVNLGLILLERMQPGMLGALGYALVSSRTLRQALATFTRYQQFLTDAMSWRWRDAQTLTVEVCDELVPIGHPVEVGIGMLVVIGRTLAGVRWVPRGLSFRHAPRGDPREHEALFGIQPRFEADSNTLEIDASTLQLPITGAPFELRAPLLSFLEDQLPGHSEPELVSQLRAALRRELAHGTSKTAIARSLGMSARTLARRLEAIGTTYGSVLDDTRRALALALLGDRQLAIYEIAFLLGYGEPSTFHRAFRRWTGETPDAWRRSRA